MIEQWFVKEVKQLLDEHHRLVITDVKGEGAFLLSLLPTNRMTILKATNRKEELQARLDAERKDREKNIVFYTTIAKRKLTQLQEYATTCGCIVLDDIEAYLKGLLFREMGIHPMVDGHALVLAAKMDRGKDEKWWRGIAQGNINPLKPDELILDFLKAPKTYKQKSDEDVFRMMQEEACRMTAKPNTPQAPDVLAREFMFSIFSKLLDRSISEELLKIYYAMVDSREMEDVIAAMNTRKYSRNPKIGPTDPISLNTFCSVMNRSPGPPDGSMSNAKQAGITAIPAIRATIVSAIGTMIAFFTRLSFFERYDPYVMMAAIPSDNEKNIWPPAVPSTPIQPVPWNASMLGLNMNSRPPKAPSHVRTLMITITSITNSAGIATVVNFSIPPATPPMMITRLITQNIAVHSTTLVPLLIKSLK